LRVQQPLRVGEERPVLEAEMDMSPLRADPGEVANALALGEAVGDPPPAGADGLDRSGNREEDQ
jgi:hypothetical protein